MKNIKLWCRIFGHEFLRKDSMESPGYTRIYASNFCRHCGLSKEELGITKHL